MQSLENYAQSLSLQDSAQLYTEEVSNGLSLVPLNAVAFNGFRSEVVQCALITQRQCLSGLKKVRLTLGEY